MVYQVRLKPRAEKELRKLPKRDHDRVLVMISSLVDNPYMGKKLKGEQKEYYVMRIWPYRMIYRIYKEKYALIIVRIAHRQGIYKK